MLIAKNIISFLKFLICGDIFLLSIEVSTIFWEKWSNYLLFFGINWVQITRCSESPPASVRRRFPRNVVPKGIATKIPPRRLWHYGQRRSTQPAMAKFWMYLFKNAAWYNVTWRTKCVQTLIDDIDEQNGTKYAFRLKDVPFLLTWGFHFGFLFKDYERLKGARAQTIT